MSRQLKLLLKIAFTLFFLAVVAYQIDLRQLGQVLARARWSLVGVAGLIMLALALISVARWRIILAAFTHDLGFGKLTQITFIGYFFNLFLPSAIGGDFVRAFYVSRETRLGMSSGLMTLLLDRAAGLLALILISLAAVLIYPLQVQGVPLLYVLLGLTAAFFLGLFAVFSDFWHGLLRRLLVWVGRPDVDDKIELLVAGLNRFRQNRTGAVKVLLLSLALQFGVVCMMWVAAQAIYIQASFWTFLVFIPLVNLTIMVPLTISGVGLREAVYFLLFTEVGVEPAQAVSLSLLNFAVLFFVAAPGALLYSLYKREIEIPDS